VIRALVEHVVATAGVADLKVGTNVFVGPLQEDELAGFPDRLVVFLERPGQAELAIGGAVGQGRVQVFVREADPWKARDLALKIHAVLHENYGRAFALRDAEDVQTGTMDAWAILGDSDPAPIGRDARGRTEFSANYTISAWKR
jgi:hypothetical protein